MSVVYIGSEENSREVQGQMTTPMEWTRQHDVMLFREILVVNPFQGRKKTTQRAQLWQSVADHLKLLEDPLFKATLSKRSVQDRCSLLCDKHKKRVAFEKRASGISLEVSELDVLIEEVLEKEELGEELRRDQNDAQKKKQTEDRLNAIDVRKTAMERLSETKKRQADACEDVVESKRSRRRSGSETIEFLREQTKADKELRERELDIQKEKQAKENAKHDEWEEVMAQQMQQQQQQMVQFQMMMTQQNNLMLAMIEKMSSKR